MSYKTIHYRYCQLTNTNENLQNLLINILSYELSIADDRRDYFNASSSDFRVLNMIKEESSMLFGQLVLVSLDLPPSILNMEEGARQYKIDLLTLSQSSNEVKKAFINSMLYFLLYKNHLVVMQSKALSARDLETYFAWLLSQSNLQQNDITLALQIQPPAETVHKINNSSVKVIKIGSPLKTFEQSSVNAQQEKTQIRSFKWANAISFDLLKAIVGDDFFKNKNLTDCFDDANLKVNLEILYSKKTTPKGQAFIDNIATSLRHLNEDDVQIKLNDGSTIRGDNLQLSTKLKIVITDGLIDETNLFNQMKTWLFAKIKDEEVNE